MRVQPTDPPQALSSTISPLQALNLVLGSIDAVRNGRAQWLLLVAFALSGLLMGELRRALLNESALWATLAALAAFIVTFYGSNAAGLMLMDEAQGRASREPRDALADAFGSAHRLLAVVACVLLLFALLLAAVAALLWSAQLPRIGPWVMGLAVTFGVPVLGLAALVMVGLIGPLAAPAVWCGLSVREVLALLRRQICHRLPQVLLLSAAVSLLSAAVAGLVSFVVLGGGRAVVALAALVTPVDIGAQTFLASLFGQGLRAAAVASTPHASAAVTGAGVVFALGLVLPGVVYLRGLCALYLAVQPAIADPAAGADDHPPEADAPDAI